MNENELAEVVEVRQEQGLVLLCAPLAEICGPLFPAESASITRAVPKRRREFTAGRLLARYGMTLLGCPAAEIPSGNLREPLWPPGLSGSISHTDTLCAVLLARKKDYLSVGIDMEEAAAVSPDLWKLIFTDTELKRLRQHPPAQRQQTAAAMYMAKEAYYKMQYPLTGQILDFQDARTLEDASGNLWITPCNTAAGMGAASYLALRRSCLDTECILIVH